MNLKAIFFDMDGTLVKFSKEEFFARVLKELGLFFDIGQVKRAYQTTDGWARQNLSDQKNPNRKLFVEWNRRLLEALGMRGDLEPLAEKVEDLWESLVIEGEQIYPEVRESLDQLIKSGLTLGIVSERGSEAIRKSVIMHRLDKYFSCLVSPQDAEAPNGKLDVRMWEVALRAVGVRASEAAHVGDLYDRDIVGARQAGILPIMIDREGKCDKDDCVKIRSLEELLGILGR